MKYSGKIGTIIPFFILMLVGAIIYSAVQSFYMLVVVFLVPLVFLLCWNFPTYLIINNDFIEARVGFHKKRLYCSDIVSVQKTHDPSQDYALSLDRIRIKTNKDSLMVSLKNNDEFIKFLLDCNSHIEFIKK